MARAAGRQLRPAGPPRSAGLAGRAHVRHRVDSTASALLLAGWLSSRLQWDIRPLQRANGDGLRGRAYTGGPRYVDIRLEPIDQDVPGLAGVTVALGGRALAVAGPRRGRSVRAGDLARSAARAAGWSWGRHGERAGFSARASGRRMLRDPTYGPALRAARELCVDTGWCECRLRSRSSTIPRAPAPRCWSASPPAGGDIVLTGGSTPQRGLRRVRRGGAHGRHRRVAAARCGSATSAACRPKTSAPTTAWSRRRCSIRSGSCPRPTVHRMKGELGPSEGADDYERELRAAGLAAVRSGAARDRA